MSNKIKLDIDHFKHFIILVTAVIKRNGKYLVVLRSKKSKTFPLFWQLPEGKLELGEQPSKTLTREIKEELDLKAKKIKFENALTLAFPVGGHMMHLLRIIARVITAGKIKLSNEHLDFRWVSKNELLKMAKLVPGTKDIFK